MENELILERERCNLNMWDLNRKWYKLYMCFHIWWHAKHEEKMGKVDLFSTKSCETNKEVVIVEAYYDSIKDFGFF